MEIPVTITQLGKRAFDAELEFEGIKVSVFSTSKKKAVKLLVSELRALLPNDKFKIKW